MDRTASNFFGLRIRPGYRLRWWWNVPSSSGATLLRYRSGDRLPMPWPQATRSVRG